VLWATAQDAVMTRRLAPDRYLTLVERHLPRERHAGIVTAVAQATVGPLLSERVPAGDAAAVHERLAAACRAGLAAGGDAVAFSRALARSGREAAELERWLELDRTDHGLALDPLLRWAAVRRLAELGALDEDTIEAERRRDGTASGDLEAATALAARPTPAAKEEAWARLGAQDIPNRVFTAVTRGLWPAEQAELAAPYLPRYLAAGPRWAARGPAFAQTVAWGFPAFHLDDAQLGLLRQALDDELPTVLRRHWQDALDDRT